MNKENLSDIADNVLTVVTMIMLIVIFPPILIVMFMDDPGGDSPSNDHNSYGDGGMF